MSRAARILLPLLLAASGLTAQTAGSRRQQAAELFEQGKRLDALPLLEEVVGANPNDAPMLVALAACLVEHAATRSDPEDGGKERLRARELLDRARDLGDASALAMNLSQLLAQLPETGAITFSDNPEADEAMREGEAAFSRRQFDEARRHYSRAMELDPRNYSAALFIGNTYDRQNEFSKGAEWYERAIGLAPNVETPYRYYADMLARQGDMGKARAMLIQAAVAEPYNRIVWRELQAWAALNQAEIRQVYVGVAPEQKGELPAIWRPYWDVKAQWQNGDEFKKHFPGEKQYRRSLPEEVEALTAAAGAYAGSGRGGAGSADPSLDLLLKLNEANLIEPYVLFSLGGPGIADDYDAYRAKNRGKLESYLDRFVVPPAKTAHR